MGKNTYRTETGKRLRELRLEKKLTTGQLAEKIGLKQNTYSTYETKHMPKQSVLILLAEFHGVTIDYLLGNEAAKPESEHQNDNNEGAAKQAYVARYDDYRPFENEDLGKVSEQEILLINAFRTASEEAKEHIIKYLKQETDNK